MLFRFCSYKGVSRSQSGVFVSCFLLLLLLCKWVHKQKAEAFFGITQGFIGSKLRKQTKNPTKIIFC